MDTKIFKKSFLDKLQKIEEKEAANRLDWYMNLGFSFHDAIVELAKLHDLEPEYVKKGEKDDSATPEDFDRLKEFLKNYGY